MNQKLKFAGAVLAGIVATVAAGGIAVASMDQGLGRMGGADANKDGQISRAEWVQTANARFVRLDANKDGNLVAAELPRKHGRGGHRGHHGPDGGPAGEPGAQPAPPTTPQTAAPATPAPQ